MLTRKIAINQANQLIQALRVFGIAPVRAILFGSVAKGKQHAWSDIDLAIWSADFTGVLGLDVEKILPVLRPFPMVEVHTFHPDESEANNPFIREIVKTGIELDVGK
ncbi:MAG TPA: nucleotidyltransferase domain-containing protein, partial [Catalimonadaceae bacterium]|jgi:predicted nucleotidyltransferase|nr:nucleotidyltransferase domain-containing protein [Catalimonadaceae bacterium]